MAGIYRCFVRGRTTQDWDMISYRVFIPERRIVKESEVKVVEVNEGEVWKQSCSFEVSFKPF